MKKVLLIDVDEVITFSDILDAINEFMHTDYSIDDFNTYFIDRDVIPQDKILEYNKYLVSRGFYKKPKVLPNAVEVIKDLNEIYDVYICSSCINLIDVNSSGAIFKDKFDFLVKLLPFINPKHFIFTSSKHLIKADIIIDDLIDNLKNDIELKILFPSYHNKEYTTDELKCFGIVRAGYDWRTGWEEIKKILL